MIKDLGLQKSFGLWCFVDGLTLVTQEWRVSGFVFSWAGFRSLGVGFRFQVLVLKREVSPGSAVHEKN